MDASYFVPELGPPSLTASQLDVGTPAGPAGLMGRMHGDPVFWIAVLLILWAGLVHVGFGVSVQAGAGE